MDKDEIKDFVARRYSSEIDEPTANLLHMRVGDPFGLVECLNQLNKKNLTPSRRSIQEIWPSAVDSAKAVFLGLGKQWQDRINLLCILHPPMHLSTIACMLNEKNVARLRDELNDSLVFLKLDLEHYDFAHPSLREYRRKDLTGIELKDLHAKAAKCLEKLWEKGSDTRFLDRQLMDLSLAEHLFLAEEYTRALDLNLRIGINQRILFDFESALLFMERAEICAQRTDNRERLAESLYQKGLIQQSSFRFPEAFDSYNRSLGILRDIGDRAGEAASLHQIGRVYEETNRFEEALESYSQSLDIKRDIGDRAGEAASLHQIGIVYQLTNRFKEALESYSQSLGILRDIGDRAGEAKSLHQIGMVYEETNRFEEALESYSQSLEIARDIGDRAGEAKSLHQIGMVYQLTNRFEQALESYSQSLDIAQKLGEKAGISANSTAILALKEKMQQHPPC